MPSMWHIEENNFFIIISYILLSFFEAFKSFHGKTQVHWGAMCNHNY